MIPHLSRGNAFKLAREIRSISGYDNLPLAFIGQAKNLDGFIDAAHAGGSLFLINQSKARTFRQSIMKLISMRQGGRPRILVVDDDDDFSQLVAAILAQEGMLIEDHMLR